MSLGIVQQFTVLWFKEALHHPYQHIYQATAPLRAAVYGPAPLSSPWKLFLLGFLGCDLAYYWFHRMAHELHGLWFTHSVHHSGERYNLATALRQGAVQPLFSWVFYLPLAAAGLPAPHMLRHLALNTVFQFWVHTEAVVNTSLPAPSCSIRHDCIPIYVHTYMPTYRIYVRVSITHAIRTASRYPRGVCRCWWSCCSTPRRTTACTTGRRATATMPGC